MFSKKQTHFSVHLPLFGFLEKYVAAFLKKASH